MKTKKILSILILAAFPVLGLAADAVPSTPEQQFATLREIAQKAVLNNPEVVAKWHNFKAATEEVDVASGGFLPKVDLIAGTGREYLKQPVFSGSKATQEGYYDRNGWLVSLNQMLFDGFATRNEVKRLGKAQLVRYYELLDASEAIALEAGRAYLDVIRYRFLVNLAEDNYVQHRATFEQLLRRTQSGVGRRVDLEQAASRLALAEVNLTTETANLHDVTARYQRIVNSQPPQVIFSPALISRALPASQKVALEKLFTNNPALLAAQENIEAADYDIAVRRAAYVPRLDFRARADNTENYLGIIGDRVNNVAEVVLTYNLFNGGSDRARERQYTERKHLAIDLRDKACRDTRQTLSIAYNDVTRLREQVSFLNIQVGLVEKTRDAYRDQFNVGQRTLLDLLDTENELLSARRAAINADMDLSLAYLRTYAGMGTLLEFLELKKLDVDTPDPGQLSTVDAAESCAAVPVAVTAIDRDALNARALALLEANRTSYALPQAQPATVQAQTAVTPPEATGPMKEVVQQVRLWAAIAARKDFAAYEGFYAPTFTPGGGISRAEWANARKERFAQKASLPVDLQNLKVRPNGLDRATAEFVQDHDDNMRPVATRKTLEFTKVGDKWLINRESSAPADKK
ncbi:MAG TPA: TolC family outer membrane protein [Azonexus sp.]|nr:TolC family outer membrane protein [Azonexus sp.]